MECTQEHWADEHGRRLTHPLTNAPAEGLNSLIAVLKGAARGLKNFANFRIRVLFYPGKFDLYPL